MTDIYLPKSARPTSTFIQLFSFRSSDSWPVPGFVDILHDTKRCKNYPRFILNTFFVNYFPCNSLAHFRGVSVDTSTTTSHFCLRVVPLLFQVCVYQIRVIVVPDHCGFPDCSSGKRTLRSIRVRNRWFFQRDYLTWRLKRQKRFPSML